MFAILIGTSLPYGNAEHSNIARTVDFASGWDVYIGGELEKANAVLPYHTKNKHIEDIEIRNTIPEMAPLVPMLETVIFQRDVRVYVDGVLIKEVVFDQKVFNQQSPGSGRIFVTLPANSEGKEIVLKFHKVIATDESPVSQISIVDGQMSESNIVSLSSPAFIVTILMFFVGICLLVTSIAYICSGVKIYSLCAMSMFVITSSLWVMCNSKLLQYFFDNWVLMHNLEYICFFSTPLWLWIFLSYNWGRHKKICNLATHILTGFCALTMTTKVLGICDYYVFLKFFHGLAVISIIVVLILGIKEFKRQSLSLKIFFIGMACLCFTSCIDLFRYYTVYAPDDMAFFYIFGIICMGCCLLMTFIIMSREKFVSSLEDSIYKEMAFTDILTGLNSRTKWEGDMAEIQTAAGKHDSILTVMLDVNGLKMVNDRFGHLVGDQMLTTVATALKTHFDGIGSVYRLGGDEFCVICLDKSIAEIDLLLSHIDLELENAQTEYPLSVAWGYAQFDPKIHNNITDVLRDADNLMYESKRRMKKTAEYWSFAQE